MEQTDNKPKLSLEVFRDLWRSSRRVSGILWTDKKWLVVGLVLALLVISTVPFLRSGSRGFLVNELVAVAGAGAATKGLTLAVVFLVLASVIPSLFFIFQNYFQRFFSFFLAEKFEMMILERRAALDIATHEDPKHNDLFNRVRESGIWRIQNFADRQFFIFQNAIETAIASAILLFANWWLFLLIFISTIPELFVEARYGRDVWNIYSSRAELRRRFWDLRWYFDRITELVELRLFQNTKHFIGLIRDLFKAFQDEEIKNERKKLSRDLIALVVSQSVGIFAIVWFVREVLIGNLQIGTLTFFLASIGDLRQSLGALFQNLGRQYQDGLFVRDVFRLVDLKPALERSETPISLPTNKTPEIIFENVFFSYPGTPKGALQNISLRITPGEKLAIVGANGAGKTTLVKLLARFYDPTKGRILVDGKDLRTIDLESWYSLLGVLFQDYSNYNFVVKDLIALGRTSEPLHFPLVKGAAEASEADLFIREWEKEYEQMIGKQYTGGVEPSIGQWQKLALARAFYRDPRILILDEPTSSIDAEAEAKIFEKLERLPKDRSVILISHRFSTVRQAEKICVLEGGALTEYGTHAELLKENKTYARLFKLQAKGYR